MAKIISGFPGVGKSYLFNTGLKCTDSDSSKFPKNGFPENYIEHIKGLLDKDLDYIFVSSHDVVRKALQEENLEYTLVYPNISLKESYIERYKKRGSPEAFVNMMENNWDSFISSCSQDPTKYHSVLMEGQYLSDVIHPFHK